MALCVFYVFFLLLFLLPLFLFLILLCCDIVFIVSRIEQRVDMR